MIAEKGFSFLLRCEEAMHTICEQLKIKELQKKAGLMTPDRLHSQSDKPLVGMVLFIFRRRDGRGVYYCADPIC